MWFHRCDALYASLGGTARSPWLLCIFDVLVLRGALRRNCRYFLFSPVRVFSVQSELLIQVFGSGALASLDRQGSASGSVPLPVGY